jgi:hypothetical protein
MVHPSRSFTSAVSRRGPGSPLRKSIWNACAWTCQEYVVFKVVQFYTEDWKLYLAKFNHRDPPAFVSEMEQANRNFCAGVGHSSSRFRQSAWTALFSLHAPNDACEGYHLFVVRDLQCRHHGHIRRGPPCDRSSVGAYSDRFVRCDSSRLD